MHATKVIAATLIALLILMLSACGPAAQDGGGTSENPAEQIAASLRREKMTQAEADAAPAPAELVTKNTACGDITGIQRDGYTEWRGIRYATAARFEAPVLVTHWDGTYDATAWGDRACQYYGFYNMADSNVSQFYIDESTIQWEAHYSEDCLNLNIWAPDDAADCPVLVYIHGGSLVTGSNTDVSTDGEAYARNGIITVAINYRLGPFHQVYGDGYTGYLALQDQAAALHWVRDNIGDYGGDGSRIFVMGESAGALSVQNLLASPLVEEGLISGAIMMSGGGDLRALNSPTSPEVVRAEWEKVKEKLGVSSIDALKDVDAKDLYAAWIRCGATSTPTVNGVSLTTDITTALANGSVQDVPVIIGMLQEDMWPRTLYDAAVDYAAKRSAAGGQPVYLYYFDRQIDETFGAFHGGDLYYMFGTLYRNVREMDDTDYRIAGEMIAYVSNFVKTGNPNGEGLTTWEPATADAKRFMHFGDEADGMVEPDISTLANNQATRSVFPYAAKIKVNPVGKPDGDSEKEDADPDSLLGKWEILGWTVDADGSWAPLDAPQYYTFDGETMAYDTGSEVMTTAYIVEGSDLQLTDWKLTWPISWDEEGQLLLGDDRYAITYVCKKTTDVS